MVQTEVEFDHDAVLACERKKVPHGGMVASAEHDDAIFRDNIYGRRWGEISGDPVALIVDKVRDVLRVDTAA